VDDPKDVAKAAGKPILDVNGMREVNGTAAAWK
jgi:hypothetical protein